MDRSYRREDRRHRDDSRDPRPRHDRIRSRSPPRRDRRDDRHRERSPPRNHARAPPSHRSERDRIPPRGRDVLASAERPRGGNSPDHKTAANHRPNEKRQANGSQRNADARDAMDIEPPGAAEDEDSEAEMRRIMGFKDFRTTKNTKIPGNDRNYAVSKARKIEYRQYMNRQGGFNRPLSPSRN